MAHAKNMEMELCFVTVFPLRFLISSGACSQRALVSWESKVFFRSMGQREKLVQVEDARVRLGRHLLCSLSVLDKC